MEVSHASTEMQAVAIGIKGKAEEVTVSTDAEFMMTIAHGIYSNKALALVRELLCNARDGHSKAGKLDTPIHVTLTDNKLVVRDHGTGIPNEIFARTYMTFGKSTKRQSKGETGGFGVGTKVPWAVCDVFSGRNFINGTMTAYSIVKSDPTMEGKPTCTPVMCIPSSEPSGVEVSVPFPEKMHGEIRKYLLQFIDELGIPIIFNGQPQKFSDEFNSPELRQVGFTRLSRHPSTVIQTSSFYVRQGDVIYPIEAQDEYADAFALLSHLNEGTNNPLLFMAEPDSIIPTLSRESLQYTERTCKSIRDLMKRALQTVADNLDEYAKKTKELFPTYVSNSSGFLSKMWDDRIEIPAYILDAHRQILYVKSLSPTQNHMLMHNMFRWLKGRTPYLESKEIVAKDFKENINETIEFHFKEKLRIYTYYNYSRLLQIKAQNKLHYKNPEYLKTLYRNTYEEAMYWTAEARYNPDIIDVSFTKRPDFYEGVTGNRASYYFLELLELKDLDIKKEEFLSRSGNYLHETLYASNTVVISVGISQMLKRAHEKFKEPHDNQNIFASRLGRLAGARFVRLRATAKPAAIDQMKKNYEKAGFTVILLMDPTREEIAEREALAAERARLKEIPLPMLDVLIYKNIRNQQRNQVKHLASNKAFRGKPLYFIIPRGKELPYNLSTVEEYSSLVKFVGNDILCVSTKTEIAKAIKEGRTSVEEALLEFVKWFLTQPGMHEKFYYRGTFFLKRSRQNKYLTQYLFNRTCPKFTTKEEEIYRALSKISGAFTSVSKYLRTRQHFYTQCCTPERHYQALFTKYADQNFCDINRALDIAYARKPSRQRALARSILKSFLKERQA